MLCSCRCVKGRGGGVLGLAPFFFFWGVFFFFFFLLACLPERLVIYEDTPTPCMENRPNFFEDGEKVTASSLPPPPPPPTPNNFFRAGLHINLKHPCWNNPAHAPVWLINDYFIKIYVPSFATELYKSNCRLQYKLKHRDSFGKEKLKNNTCSIFDNTLSKVFLNNFHAWNRS